MSFRTRSLVPGSQRRSIAKAIPPPPMNRSPTGFSLAATMALATTIGS
jgi:hypothetical protein